MSQFLLYSLWPLRSCWSLLAVIAKAIAAIDAAAVGRMKSNASQHAEIAKELHAKIALMMRKSLKKTLTSIHETSLTVFISLNSKDCDF